MDWITTYLFHGGLFFLQLGGTGHDDLPEFISLAPWKIPEIFGMLLVLLYLSLQEVNFAFHLPNRRWRHNYYVMAWMRPCAERLRLTVEHHRRPTHRAAGTFWNVGDWSTLIFAIFKSKRIDCGPHHISSLAPTKMFDVPTALTHARKARARAFWCQWVYHWFNWRCASHHSACYIPST